MHAILSQGWSLSGLLLVIEDFFDGLAISCTKHWVTKCMLFVCEVEKQVNIIHVGISVAGNFLHLEGQAALRSSGIDTARIWYLVILDLVFVSC